MHADAAELNAIMNKVVAKTVPSWIGKVSYQAAQMGIAKPETVRLIQEHLIQQELDHEVGCIRGLMAGCYRWVKNQSGENECH